MKVPEILNPETWVPYSPALCETCWAGCCTLPVQVSSEDLFHMGFVNAGEVNGPLRPIADRLTTRGIIQSFNESRSEFTLSQQNGCDCIFLDEQRRCSLYDRRPYVCRQFPRGSARPGFCPSQSKRD